MARRVITQQDMAWSAPQSPDSLRVLIETDDVPEAWAMQGVLEEAGHQVAWCEGPTRHRPCPMVVEGGCELVDEADVVVHDLRLSSPAYREVLSAVRANSPATPVVVAATTMEAARHAEQLAGCQTLRLPYRGSELAAAILDAT